MRTIEDLTYHQDRARAELDCGYRARPGRAADAHLRLSALHMKRALEISRARPPAPFGGETRRAAATGIGSPALLAALVYAGKSGDAG